MMQKAASWVWGFLLAGALVGAHNVQAETTHTITQSNLPDAYVGGLLGFSSTNSNVGTGLGFGVNAGYYFIGDIGAGLFLRTANHSSTPASSTFAYGAEGLYRLNQLLPGLQAGVRAGTLKITTGKLSKSGLLLGAKAAYDIPISSEYPLTIGAEVDFDMAMIGNTTLGSTNPMARAKFWF